MAPRSATARTTTATESWTTTPRTRSPSTSTVMATALATPRSWGCRLAPGLSGFDGDCNDGDATVHPRRLRGLRRRDQAGLRSRRPSYDCDGDGVDGAYAANGGAGTDCDDASAVTYPGALEICDGADNDCDGGIDKPAHRARREPGVLPRPRRRRLRRRGPTVPAHLRGSCRHGDQRRGLQRPRRCGVPRSGRAVRRHRQRLRSVRWTKSVIAGHRAFFRGRRRGRLLAIRAVCTPSASDCAPQDNRTWLSVDNADDCDDSDSAINAGRG